MRERDLMRWIHLFGALAIGTFVYSPWHDEPAFVLSMRVLIVPILILTGLWMWQGHRMKKLFDSSKHKIEAS